MRPAHALLHGGDAPAMKASAGGGKMALVLLLLACHSPQGAGRRGRRPWYVRCQDSSECGPGKCCSVMAGRYMVPLCMPMKRRPGEHCSAHAVNVTARYPRAAKVSLTDVHIETCPCHENMVCQGGLCRLQDISSNSLLEK